MPYIMLPSWLPIFFNERLQEFHLQMATPPIIKKKEKKKKKWKKGRKKKERERGCYCKMLCNCGSVEGSGLPIPCSTKEES